MGNSVSGLVFRPPTPPLYHFPYDEEERAIDNTWELRNANGMSKHLLWLKTKRDKNIPAFFIEQSGSPLVFLYSHGTGQDLG